MTNHGNTANTSFVLFIAVAGAAMAIGFLAARVSTPKAAPAAVRPPAPVLPAPEAPKSVEPAPADDALRKLEARMATVEGENRTLIERNRDLLAEMRELKDQLARKSKAAARLADSSTAAAPTGSLARAMQRHIYALDPVKGLTADAAKDIGLTEDQCSVVNQTFRKAAEKVKALELANADVKYASDDQIIIKVNAFPKEGEEVKAALMSELQNALPSDTYKSLNEQIGDQMDAPFSGFGEMSRDFTIKTEASALDGRKQYRITDASTSSGSGTSAAQNSTMAITFGSGSTAVSSSSGGFTMSTMTGDGGNKHMSRMRQLYTSQIPPEYAHFLPGEGKP